MLNNVDNFELFYMPTLLVDKKICSTLKKKFRYSKFLCKEPYLHIVDWIRITILPFQKIIVSEHYDFLGFEISRLITQELNIFRFSTSKLIAELNFNFIKRLKKEKINIIAFLEWYENQVIDRGSGESP